MKIEKVNYQKAYVIGPYLQEKIGFEVSLDDGDSPEAAITALKELADKWHKENNPLLNLDTGFGPGVFPSVTTPVPPVINRADQRLMDLLEDCTTLEELNRYLPEVEAARSHQVNQVWDKMGAKLFNK